jgi:hypothetical protein
VPSAVRALVLTPGASAGRDQASLVSIDDALTAEGLVVSRLDFPYRIAGRRAPDRQPVLVASILAEAARLASDAGLEPAHIAFGGRSMGGRMCSIAVAEGLLAAALVLVSYPLHPPGKPDNLRTAHFDALDLPCLFVSGTRDAFGTVAELETASAAIPGPVTHVWLEGGDHGLRGKDRLVTAAVEEFVLSL